MGRKKIAITRIQDERNRQITFSKRKGGLLKKAYELSILCDVEIAVIMITSNGKLYQYASSNMNSILIRYTEFKDPDESKTNADILEDITKKERGPHGHDDSGGEEEDASSQFLLTPRTQAQYQKIDEEFDHILRRNQLAGMPTPLASAPAGTVSHIPQAMPVTVPVAPSPPTIHQQIQLHLQQQMGQRSASVASMSSASSSGSGHASSSDPSPSGPSSSSSAKSPGAGMRSPNMPPPLNTPTRLQTLRNQTLKLHLPGSGRNYISLGPGSGGTSPGKKSGGGGGSGGGEGDEGGGAQGGGTTAAGGASNKPHLRVVIPGQKEFVPRTQSTSPLPQVGFTSGTGAAPQPATQPHTTANTESLTTPILSLHTPNLFSALPPLFSSFMGDFPFSGLPSSSGASASGTGGGGEHHSALVAFPVSIQPSSVSGGASGSNIILQAQNMGQPFLLTPTYDRGGGGGGGGTNPVISSQVFTPPTTLSGAGTTPGSRDLEHLKLQYDRLQQQMLQQQLLLQQGLQHHLQQQQQSRGMVAASAATAASQDGANHQPGTSRDREKRERSRRDETQAHSQFITTSDVMMTSRPGSATTPAHEVGEGDGEAISMDTDESSGSASKKPKLINES